MKPPAKKVAEFAFPLGYENKPSGTVCVRSTITWGLDYHPSRRDAVKALRSTLGKPGAYTHYRFPAGKTTKL